MYANWKFLPVGKQGISWVKRYLPGMLILLFVALALNSFIPNKNGLNDAFQDLFNKNYSIFALTLPGELEFAGEEVPMKYFDVRENLDRELLVNTYWQSQTLLFIKRANRYFPLIEDILRKNDIPDDFKYLALAESGLMQVVSPTGATGFWQFMAGTARDYGLEVNKEVDERYNIEKSTEAACKYLAESYSKYGNWTMVAASYNNGRRGMDKQLKRQEEDNYYDLLLNEETSRYLFRLLALKLILSDPQKYGFHFRADDLYPPILTRKVKVDSSITSMVRFASFFNLNYKMLKYFNPWLRETQLSNKDGKLYEISIPLEDFRTGVYQGEPLMLINPNGIEMEEVRDER